MKNLTALMIPVLAVLLVSGFIPINTEPSWGQNEVAFIGEDALPDLASPTGIEIGGVRGEWGGVIRVSTADASHTDNGKCVFHFNIEISNLSTAPAENFDFRLNAGNWSAVSGLPGIGAGKSVSAVGDIALAPGRQKVVIKLDNNESIAESDELNNVPFALRVDVDGDCSSTSENDPMLANNSNN